MLGNLHEYAGKPLKHVAKGELPLGEADKAKQEEATKAAAPLLDKLKGLLGDRVEDVRVSARLTDSPSCLAMSEWELDRKSTRMHSSHSCASCMPSSASRNKQLT